MGSLLQLLVSQGGKYQTYQKYQIIMQVLALLLSAGLVCASVSHVKRAGSHGPHCEDHTKHNCKKIPKQEERKECHVEYDIVEDVTYIEECEYVTTTLCEEGHETITHSSHVVGHDFQKFHEGHHHGGLLLKREAEHGHGGHQSLSTGPKCSDNTDKQCKKVPKTESHKVPKHLCKTIVNTKYIEECEEITTTNCTETHEKSFHTTHVVGHDSYVERKHQSKKH